MKSMRGLQQVATEVMRRLETGQLPVETATLPNSEDKPTKLHSITPHRSSSESLTKAQAIRRETIKRMILRYHAEKHLDPLSDDDLRSYVRAYDEHFTYNGIPTERIADVYLEAIATHGAYLLKVDDYLRAWERIRPKEGAGVDTRPMGERGSQCAICGGTGMTKIFIPTSISSPTVGSEVEKECPYHCRVVTALQQRTA